MLAQAMVPTISEAEEKETRESYRVLQLIIHKHMPFLLTFHWFWHGPPQLQKNENFRHIYVQEGTEIQ
jgi:hypothetical protein